MSIKITSDSTCDLTPEYINNNNIGIVSLYINKGGETFRDNIDIFPEDMFLHTESTGNICSTSALNPADYTKLFSELSPLHEAVIHINIGSKFSACHQSAAIAAAEYPNVYTVDSCNLSSGQGHLVALAVEMANTGMDPVVICDRLREFAGRVEASFLLDRLDYMSKGGRCSSVTALGANLLKLKPCIEVADGKMRVGKKYRGALDKCIREYVKDRLCGRDDIIYERIFITHTTSDKYFTQVARDAVNLYADFSEVTETRAGCTISGHCGPNTLGILFIRSK
ncbi:MAG: DegV family protein [Oscillospiraceae bacterium]|nr:DegV family protein [Oscillospiraceae bacterium]